VLSSSERIALATKADLGVPPFEWGQASPIGFGHSGSFGQYLLVLPKARVVAVRQVREQGGELDFVHLLRGCVEAP